MPKTVNVHDAQTHLSRLLKEAHAGQEIILAKADKPYARLCPLGEQKRELGFVKGHVTEAFFEPLTEDGLKRSE